MKKYALVHRVYVTVALTVAAPHEEAMRAFEDDLRGDLIGASNYKSRQKRHDVEILVPPTIDTLHRPAGEVKPA